MTNREAIEELKSMYRIVCRTDSLRDTIRTNKRNAAIDKAVHALEEQERNGWIPLIWRKATDDELSGKEFDEEECPFYTDCRMPEDGQEILLCDKSGYVWKDTCLIDCDGYWLEGGYDWVTDVAAWMPLPESYRGDSHEE